MSRGKKYEPPGDVSIGEPPGYCAGGLPRVFAGRVSDSRVSDSRGTSTEGRSSCRGGIRLRFRRTVLDPVEAGRPVAAIADQFGVPG